MGTWATHPLPPSLLPSPSLFCDNYSLFSLVSPSSYSSSTYFHSLLSLPPSLFVLTFIPLHPSLSPSLLQPLPQPSLPFLFPPHSSSVFFMLLFFSSLIHFLSLLPVYPSLSPSFVLLICPFLFISLPLMHFLPIHFFFLSPFLFCLSFPFHPLYQSPFSSYFHLFRFLGFSVSSHSNSFYPFLVLSLPLSHPPISFIRSSFGQFLPCHCSLSSIFTVFPFPSPSLFSLILFSYSLPFQLCPFCSLYFSSVCFSCSLFIRFCSVFFHPFLYHCSFSFSSF